ncbi:hypothetical protein [Thermogutta sp.]|uniref:hypothetical protein n=1 Tax=Thermogutta sp. TaxID=1962930 RepID=UPI0032206E88
MREAFHSLRQVIKDPITTPVGVLITKWDRYSAIDFDSPQNECEQLEKFLREKREYSSLVHSVRSTIVFEQEGVEDGDSPAATDSGTENLRGLAENIAVPHGVRPNYILPSSGQVEPIEHFLVAPVSAFGQSTSANGKDLPAGSLRPFNALQPLVWLAKRRDELDLRAFEKQWTRLKNWFWLPGWFVWPGVRKFRDKVQRLGLRMAKGSPFRRQYSGLRRGVALLISLSAVLSLVYLTVVGDGIVSAWHVREFWLAKQSLDNATSTVEALFAHRERLNSWPKRLYTGFLTQFFVTEESRQETVENLDKQMDNILYTQFQPAPGEVEKIKLAKDYLKYLPNGPHAEEIRNFIDRINWENRVRENEEALAKLIREWPKNAIGDKVKEYKKSVDGFQWPHSDAAPRELQEKLANFRAEVEKWYWTQTFTELRKNVGDLVEAGQFSQAVHELFAISPEHRSNEWANIAEKVASEIPTALENIIRSLVSKGSYGEALKHSHSAEQALKDLENATRVNQKSVAEKALAGVQKITRIRDYINEDYDKVLYRIVQESRTRKACEDYLQYAPLKTMAQHVQAYLDYLQKIEMPMSLTVGVAIIWDPDYKPDDVAIPGENYITVIVNEDKVLRKGPYGENEGTSKIGTFSLQADKGAETSWHFVISILEVDVFFDDFGGHGEKDISARELSTGVEIPLRGAGFENKAHLKILEGWPPEPELPQWIR